MRVIITINCDNDAFRPEGLEVARILREQADRIEQRISIRGSDASILRDFNGNRCGEFEVME